MRLVDLDKIEINEECTFSGKGIRAFLDTIPAAYDVDKIIERIEEKKNECAARYKKNTLKKRGLGASREEEIALAEIGICNFAIEIIRSGGIQNGK